jgi:hypothetical protein
MVSPLAVSAKLEETVTAAARALNTEDSMAYQNFDHYIRELQLFSREAFQARFVDSYPQVVRKLEQGEALNEAEQDMVRLLVVGTAKFYLEHENDLAHWRDELGRLVAEMQQVEAQGLDESESLLRLQALCREARAILPNIATYYEEKERVARFEAAMGGPLDAEAGGILADVIRNMMTSTKM